MVRNHKNGNRYLKKSQMNAAIQQSQQSWNIKKYKEDEIKGSKLNSHQKNSYEDKDEDRVGEINIEEQ